MQYIIIVTEPSSPPLNIEANATDSHSISLHWEPPLPTDHNGQIVSYLINMAAIETGETYQITTTMSYYTFSLLTLFTIYEFVIAASTKVGPGPFSQAISVLTPEDGKRLQLSCLIVTLGTLTVYTWSGVLLQSCIHMYSSSKSRT